MEKAKLERNIIIYYVFQLLREPLFWGPIMILYIQRTSHISLAGIYAMEAVALASIFLLEIPTGAIADILGRRRTIVIGSCFLVLEHLLFATSVNPLMAWLSNNLFWVVGYSLVSGADSAMLYDTLLALGRENEFKKIQGRSISYRLALMAVCSILAGYLAQIHLRLPAVAGLFFIAINGIATFFFVDPPSLCFGEASPPPFRFGEASPPKNQSRKFNFKEHVDLMKLSILFVANHQRVKWIIGFMAFIGVVSKLWFFTYNPYFELVKLPLWIFGWIFFALNVIAAVSSYYADWLAKKMGEFGSIAFMTFLIIWPILLMGFYPCQPFAFLVLVQNVVRGYLGPFMDHFLHQHLDSENRATAMSVKSAAIALVQFIGLGIFGLLVKMYSLPTCLLFLGFTALFFGLIALVSYFRVFRKT